MILYAASDLLWATRIKATAEAIGVAARPVRSEEMLLARLADSPVRALIVDLETGDLGPRLIELVKARANLPVLAFGPHVAIEAMDAARRAGADRVMARGAFSDRLADLLTTLDAPPGGA
ncbi:MAG: hypothetical protein IPJ41_06945 [Phycisphaerales bacterium]|nr:hypothetical protein [Phycisphaerales bacterium]